MWCGLVNIAQWAGLSVMIVFVLLSFRPILRIVLLARLLIETFLNLPQQPLMAVAGGNRWFYPPILLIREPAFLVLGTMAFVGTVIGMLAQR